jgi:aspartate racemase
MAYIQTGMDNGNQGRTFGLVAGLGVGAGIFYYRALVAAHLSRGLVPRLLMVHADVRRVMSHAAAGEALQLAGYLAELLRQLACGGAQLAAIPAFTPQICAAELAAITPLPLVGLLDVIAEAVMGKRFRRVAILGARVAIETQLFGKLEGVEVVMPTPDEVDTIAGVYGRVVEESCPANEAYDLLRRLAHTLIERENLDGIVLAGTDLAFVFNPTDTDFPHVDGARVHVDAIMREIAREPL